MSIVHQPKKKKKSTGPGINKRKNFTRKPCSLNKVNDLFGNIMTQTFDLCDITIQNDFISLSIICPTGLRISFVSL